MLSAICLNLDQSKNLSSGNGLKHHALMEGLMAFYDSSFKLYVVGTHKNNLNKTVQIRTYNIRFDMLS